MIKAGDTIPDARVFVLEDGKPSSVKIHDLFAAKTVVLFGIPAAFSPGCTNTHCPSYIRDAAKLRSAGVDLVAMTAVNDAWTLNAYALSMKIGDSFLMLADGNAELTKALGLTNNLSGAGAGECRSRRYAMIIDNLEVKYIALDKMELTTADAILKAKL